MAEHDLERVGVTAIAKEVDGEGMAEAVDIDMAQAGAPADDAHGMQQLAVVQRMAVAGGEEAAADGILFAFGKVAPDGLAGGGRDGNGALFAAFAEDGDAAVLEIHLVDLQVAQFGGADAGIDQEQDDGTVAGSVGNGMGGGALSRSRIEWRGGQAGGHGADIIQGVRDDGALLGPGALDSLKDALDDQALGLAPGPQGGEAGVVVEQSLLGDGLAGQEGLYLGGGGDRK